MDDIHVRRMANPLLYIYSSQMRSLISGKCCVPFCADCVLSAVGKPVFNRFSPTSAGCWMKDPGGTGVNLEKYWVTRVDDTSHLYEFSNKTAFTRDRSTRNFTLPFPFRVSKSPTIFYLLHTLWSSHSLVVDINFISINVFLFFTSFFYSIRMFL